MDRFVISLIVIIGGITGFVLYQISAEVTCLPKDLSQIQLGFPFKLPTVLPTGYTLQGVWHDDGPITIFDYGTHPVCSDPPHSDLYYREAQLSISVEYSETQIHSGMQAIPPKAVLINSYKGWISQYNDHIMGFLNDKDQVEYTVEGDPSMTTNQTLAVTRSIPP